MSYLPEPALIPVQSHVEYLAAMEKACELASAKDWAAWEMLLASVDAWESWRGTLG